MEIKFVGDVMLGELLENYDRGVRTFIRQGVDPFEFCKDDLKSSDLCVANLECVLTDTSNKKDIYRDILRAPRQSVKVLKNSGINVVNLANNHSLDHGFEALNNTIENLESEGILTFGYNHGGYQEEPLVVTRKGSTVGFLGYNLSNYNYKKFCDSIERINMLSAAAKRKVNLLVVSLHWGHEYSDTIPPDLCDIAKHLLESGCDLLYGHHSHRLQGVLLWKGRLVAPSLGNFIFDDRRRENRLTASLRVIIDNDEIKQYSLQPYYVNRYFQPVPADFRFHDLEKLNHRLERMFEITDEEERKSALENVLKMSRRGHLKNRVRMRVLMILHWYNYYGNILNLINHRKLKQFSVTDDL